MKQKNIVLWTFLFNLLFFIIGLLILSHIPLFTVRTWIHGFGFFGVSVYIVLYFFLFIIPFNPIPKNVVTYFALVSFGPILALATTLFADLLGVLFNYSIALRFHRFFPNPWKKSLRQFEDISFWALFVARIIPVTEGFVGADFPSYGAGAIKMPLASFLIATFIPWIVIDTIYFFSLNYFIGSKLLIPVFIIVVGFSLLQILIKLRKK